MDKNLHFISSKAKELKTAIFCNFSESPFRFPPTIIEIMDVDDHGNAWFAVNNPCGNLNGFDKEFPAELQLYNKDYPYYMKVRGKAFLELDPVCTPPAVGITQEASLIRLKILNAECIDLPRPRPAKRNILGWIENLFAWLFHTNEGYYYDWN